MATWTTPRRRKCSSLWLAILFLLLATSGALAEYSPPAPGHDQAQLTNHSAVVDFSAATGNEAPGEALPQSPSTPVFVDVAANLIGTSTGSVGWGDYNHDSRLDLLVTGLTASNATSTRIYRNDGNNAFADSGIALQNVFASDAAWGDFNRDGYPDIALTGQTAASGGTSVTRLYRNGGNGAFVDTNVAFGVFGAGSLGWGDYNRDGYPDLAISGRDQTEKSVIFRNNGNGTFSDIAAGLYGVMYGTLAWGDYDADGDSDLLITGWNYTPYAGVSRLYRNDNGAFQQVTAPLTGVFESSAAWGDYDGDGDLDIALAGCTSAFCNSLAQASIYRNNGNNVFVKITAPLPNLGVGAVAWLDYDRDQDLDLAISGCTVYSSPNCTTAKTEIFRNDGNDTFVATTSALASVSWSALAVGDFDNDGDPDLALNGKNATGAPVTKIYRNDTPAAGGYSVSGRVTDGSGSPVAGVTVSDGAGHSTVTDSNGDYALNGLPAGNYTLTPSKSGCSFNPPTRTVALPPNGTGQNFTANCNCGTGSSAVDALLVIDRSGSMGGTPLDQEKVAAKGFVDRMSLAQDQVGLASFETSATLNHQLSHDGNSVKNAIDALTVGGSTNIGEGINVAQAELRSSRHNPNARPVMLLMSDGQPNVGPDPVGAAQAAKNAGTRIFTIGLGSVDQNLMRQLASSPSDYYYAPTPADLASIYQTIAGVVSCAPTKVKIDPPIKRVARNVPTFTLNVVIQDVVNLGAFQFDVTYNPSIVHVTSVSIGAFPGSTGRTVSPVGPVIDNSAGRVTFGAFTFGTQPGPNGTGVLAIITFAPRAGGTSPIQIQNLQVADIASNPISASIENGQVEIISCFGDFDGDNDVDIFDLQMAASHWNCRTGNSCYDTRFDTEPNGVIDVTDLQRFAAAWGTVCTVVRGSDAATTLAELAEQPAAVSLHTTPPTPLLLAGSVFSQTVFIQDAANVGAFQTDLVYDPAIVRVEAVSIGPFLSSTGRTVTPVGPVIDHSAGRVTFGAFTFGSQPGASGAGNLAHVRLRALAVGASQLSFQQTTVNDTTGNPLPLTNLTGSTLQVIGQAPIKASLPLILRAN